MICEPHLIVSCEWNTKGEYFYNREDSLVFQHTFPDNGQLITTSLHTHSQQFSHKTTSWRRCGGSFEEMFLLIGGDVVAYWRRCGGSLEEMGGFIGGDVWAH